MRICSVRHILRPACTLLDILTGPPEVRRPAHRSMPLQHAHPGLATLSGSGVRKQLR